MNRLASTISGANAESIFEWNTLDISLEKSAQKSNEDVKALLFHH
jgi:hypothetical protein